MPEIATITAAISSVKNALDIAKALKAADKTFEKAETRLEMSKLMDALFEARENALEVKELLQEKENMIARLEKALEFQGKIIRRYDAYYELDEKGDPYGEAYCSHCWEASHKAIHLIRDLRYFPVYPLCKTTYDRSRAASIIE